MRALGRLAGAACLAAAVLVGCPVTVDARPPVSAPGREPVPSVRDASKAKPKPRGKGKGSTAARSIGPPNAGRLEGAARLRKTPHLTLRAGARPYALPHLVGALTRASAAVARKHPGAHVLVGDLSSKNGGPIARHRSHQSGRDVDVGFYTLNSRRRPVVMSRFVAFDAGGRGKDLRWALFDEARNWAFVEALLSDPKITVRHVFVTNELRTRLLDHAAQKGRPKAVIARAARAMLSPADVDLHDDHFHIRLACPGDMRGVCVEDSVPRSRGGSDAAAVADSFPAEPKPEPPPRAAPEATSPENAPPREHEAQKPTTPVGEPSVPADPQTSPASAPRQPSDDD